jgi:hypothetical protein
LDQTVEVGACFGAGDSVAEHPVVAPDDKRSYLILGAIVVELDPPIVKETNEFGHWPTV